MGTPQRIDINEFENSSALLEPTDALLVVKSQDQIARRKRMLGQLRRGKIGRLQPRPIADGLLVKCQIPPNAGSHIRSENAEFAASFPEPRHAVRFEPGTYLLTEVARVDLINEQGQILDTFCHPYFAFLHSVALNQRRDRMLVASAGYDAILELDLRTKQETWNWFGWDHGFNPNEEGVYYTNTAAKAEELKAKGHLAKYINPKEYNEYGLLTAARTTHPNVAFYNPYKSEATVIASLGYGKIGEIDRKTSECEIKIDLQAPVLHGVMPYEQGWMLTNTCRGEFSLLDRDFNPLQQYSFRNLPGKVAEAAEWEWLQLVIPIGEGKFCGLDANRGIIICDTVKRCYEILHPDPNWCLQDALIL